MQFGPFDFVQISLASGANIFMYGETLDFQDLSDFRLVSISNANYCKQTISDRVFYVTIADADVGSLKSLHTIFDKYLDHMLVNLNKIVWSEI